MLLQSEFPSLCAQLASQIFAETELVATSQVIREVVIQDGDRETLGFDCRLLRGHRKLCWFAWVERLSNPGRKVDTCGVSPVRRPRFTAHQ